jgi:hydroxymethylpyrimidine kinase/phosphomethylpyrimidine kinase
VESRACVLVLSGLDPGGGAGLLADARALQSTGAFACGVVTVLTVQSTSGLRRTETIRSSLWTEQARVVLRDQRVRAIKVGALGSASNVRAAAALLASHRDVPAVVDPVLVPTRGSGRLLAERAVATLRRELVPRAALVTANAAEAEVLTRARVTNVAEARVAARAIVAMGARAALVKGGHLADARAIDVLATEKSLIELSSPRLRFRRKIHGAGCALSSLIAGRLAVMGELIPAVRWAKRRHHAALSNVIDVGGDLLVLM